VIKLRIQCGDIEDIKRNIAENASVIAEKASLLDFKGLQDQLEFECPTLRAFTLLQQHVQGKAEWLDLGDALKQQSRDGE